MRNRHVMVTVAAATAALASTPASAATFVVQAEANSSAGTGSALDTGLALTAGQLLTVSASTNDLWSAGALPRYSDANGLTGDRFATAADDSGEAIGTLIGTDYGQYLQDGFSAPFGALVGRIGGVYQLLGTSFNGAAWGTGVLELLYWDSNSADNFGGIDVNVQAAAVPEPAVWAMLLAGFGLVGGALRRQRRTVRRRLSYG